MEAKWGGGRVGGTNLHRVDFARSFALHLQDLRTRGRNIVGLVRFANRSLFFAYVAECAASDVSQNLNTNTSRRY